MSPLQTRRRALILGGAAMTGALTTARALARPPAASAVEPDLFTAWCKLYASTADGEVHWWSFGTLWAQVEGIGDVPALRTEAVRVCRIRSGPDQVTVTWKEIGAYLDPATGLPAQTWANPVTGEARPAPRAFEEGVGVYTLTREGVLTLKQRCARPWRNTLTAKVEAGRAILDQDEVKTRAFPYPDGESPDITEPNAVVNDAHVQIYGDAAEVRDIGIASARAAGRFNTLFGGAPSWMVFPGRVTRAVASGTMAKTAATADAFPQARARLQAVHPDYFRKGRISWD